MPLPVGYVWDGTGVITATSVPGWPHQFSRRAVSMRLLAMDSPSSRHLA